MEKKLLRARIRKKKALLTEEYKNEASKKICDLFLSSKEYKAADSIFIYISGKDEVSTVKIISDALEDNKTVYVPKCIGEGIMIPVKIDAETEYVTGYKGLTEPVTDSYSYDDFNADVSVVPCISASYEGKRLGHGGGFYDRFLAENKSLKICLCFSDLIESIIPTDNHDILMDAVITEEGFFSCRNSFSV